MGRLLVTILVWGLLVATTVAFVATEALKLERPLVSDLSRTRAFSPGCDCPKPSALVSFRLGRRAVLDVEVIDADDEAVRALASGLREGRGRVRLEWDGRDDRGALVPDGEYRVRVRVEEEDREVTFGQPIVADRATPVVELLAARPDELRAGAEVEIDFRVGETARVRLLGNGRRLAGLGRFQGGSRRATWSTAGVPPGRYVLALSALDRAGNRSPASSSLTVRIAGSGE
ncbi:MAG TPA: FlgD immunoglobulin-like domain containing protein [Gaiellaceae bacterium]|nr:FlgD immunoglobulin-like domain containing protein [Gaiellaceae bacterium]